jgi:UDP-N-acetylmuramoyl-L-alanyl-D-glutamate--2,6-diaminopimelate ligase
MYQSSQKGQAEVSTHPPSPGTDSRTSTDTSSAGILLDDLFAQRDTTSRHGVYATSCTSDCRQLEPGDVYVAIDGEMEDGHDMAREASRLGAKAIVCERPVPVFDIPIYLVEDTRIAFGQLCHAMVNHPTRSLPTVGVTGTLGKTTVVALLDSIFAAAGKHAGSLSDLGCYDGMCHGSPLGDGPTPAWMASRLARMSAAGCSHAVTEVSSRSLVQAGLSGMQLDAVCVTQVTNAHLDLHHTKQNYRVAKRRILDYLSPGGVTVLCADDPVSMSWLDSLSGPVLTYGLGTQAEITGSVIQQNAGEQLLVLSAGNESVALRTRMLGRHHVLNCLAAAATALAYGIDLTTAARGIESLGPLPGRMERVDCGQGYPVFVDVAKTPDALQACLRTARQISNRRVICVLEELCGGSECEHNLIRHIVDRLADVVILSGNQHEKSAAMNKHQWASSFHRVAERYDAIADAVAMAGPGDVVVIAGSRPAPKGTFGHSTKGTADVEVAKQLLAARYQPKSYLAA